MIYIIFFLAVALNGATDAANAVTGVVSGGIMPYRRAAFLSAALNFLGLMCFAAFAPALAETVSQFSAGDPREGAAALMTVVIFAGGAWILSVPTSESHAMIAAMAGASAASGGVINRELLIYINIGALASAVMGAFFSACLRRLIPESFLQKKWVAVLGCAAASVLHGAQDGQKFLALAIGAGILSAGTSSSAKVAFVMFLGTLFGGRRIVRKLGEQMTEVDIPSAVASDIGSAVSLLAVTLLGIPASTTHTKTCAIAGAATVSGKRVDIKELGSILAGWIVTVPVCFLLGWSLCRYVI